MRPSLGNRSLPSTKMVGEPANGTREASSGVRNSMKLTSVLDTPRSFSAVRILEPASTQFGQSSM